MKLTFSYQARVATTPAQHEVLSAYVEKRSLFAALAAGRDKNQIKREFLQRFGITGRQFNSVRVELEARLRAVKESQVTQVEQLQQQMRFDLNLYGKTSGQAQAVILELAAEKGKPLVVEKLDFQRKRAQLEGESPTSSLPPVVRFCLQQDSGWSQTCCLQSWCRRV